MLGLTGTVRLHRLASAPEHEKGQFFLQQTPRGAPVVLPYGLPGFSSRGQSNRESRYTLGCRWRRWGKRSPHRPRSSTPSCRDRQWSPGSGQLLPFLLLHRTSLIGRDGFPGSDIGELGGGGGNLLRREASCVPSGLRGGWRPVPGVETPGFIPAALRALSERWWAGFRAWVTSSRGRARDQVYGLVQVHGREQASSVRIQARRAAGIEP